MTTHKAIHKIIHPCTTEGIPVFCKITYKDGNLSIIGVEGPTEDGNCAGGCGQIDVSMRDYPPESVLFRPGWNAALFRQFLNTWEKWHLNDMHAGCEHQRAMWDADKKITVTCYDGSRKYAALREEASRGSLPLEEYAGFQKISQRVYAATIACPRPRYKSPEIQDLLAAGYIIEKGTEIRNTCHIKESEHPEGILCKPCPVCGYKYGTKWLKEEVPADILDFLRSLPDADRSPAWI